MQEALISFEGHGFPYYHGWSCQDEIFSRLSRYDADRFFIVTDPVVRDLYAEDFCAKLDRIIPSRILCLKAVRETAKTIEEVSRLAGLALQHGVTRRSVVIALGGGVPGNLGGLLAGLLFRGIRLVHIPTTLIAMHDSVISLKQAVNFGSSKNILGLYKVPVAVFADVQMLETLPDREIRSGLIENVKNALAIMPEQIPALMQILQANRLQHRDFLHLLDLSLAAKYAVMAHDRHERRAGMVLEYGHTVGHAIELIHSKRAVDDPVSHGEAIGIGMRVAGRIANDLGFLSHEDWARHEELLDRAGVPNRLPTGVPPAEVLARLRRDNKRGLLNVDADEMATMILLRGLGAPCRTNEVPLVAVPMRAVEAAVAVVAVGDVPPRQRSRAPRQAADPR